MPATRSNVRESRKKRLLNTCPVSASANQPEWDNDWLDKMIPAPEAEFDKTNTTPTDARPPPLTLGDFECIKTVESHSKVLLVRSKRNSHHLDSGSLFALKTIPRKSIRENAGILALEVSAAKANDNEVTETRKDILLRENEVSILAKLAWHPFIAGLVDTFYDSQNLYLALEYAPHGTLRSLLQQSSLGRMKPRDANFYFANILAAVDFLHIQGIIHRDIKPENILLNSDGYLCLTDFGSACLLDAFGESPKLGGTCAYMAPEWHHINLDPRTLDWWSCGCILFEMATGKVAFLKKETSYDLTWPPNAAVGKHLKDLIEKLLDADPSERPSRDGAADIAKHPWLKAVDWEKMLGRHYLPPFIPRAIKTTELWHKYPLPEQHVVPGLSLIEPPIHLENDDRFPNKWDY